MAIRKSTIKHGMYGTPTYHSWQAMKERCYRRYHPAYSMYGGRGITVCDRWKSSFQAFVDDMGVRPEGKTLDRFPDKDGNYEPGNCRWATGAEQQRNKSTTAILNGIAVADIADSIGINRNTAYQRFLKGTEITRPVSPRNRYIFTHNGQTMPLKEWAKKLGFNYQTLRCRAMNGETPKTGLFSEKKQGSNPRRLLKFGFRGRVFSLAELAAELGVNAESLRSRHIRDSLPVGVTRISAGGALSPAT